jgi:hypothetical protein
MLEQTANFFAGAGDVAVDNLRQPLGDGLRQQGGIRAALIYGSSAPAQSQTHGALYD